VSLKGVIAIPVGFGLLIGISRWIRFIRRHCVHLHDITHKLGVDSRIKLTRYTRENGLV